MTWLEAIARYLCGQCTGTTYNDVNGVMRPVPAFVFGKNTYVHQGGEAKLPFMVVIGSDGDHQEKQHDDPREFPNVTILVHGKDWHLVDSAMKEIQTAVSGTKQIFDAPSASSPAIRARSITPGNPQRLGTDEYERCVGQLDLKLEYVNL